MQLTFNSGGKTIRVDATETPGDSGARPAILLLHGAGGNVGFWLDRMGPALASAGVCLYAVHYFDRTGTTRADLQTLADGVHVPLWLSTIEDAVRFVASRPAVDSQRIALAGISLGAFLALALAAQRPGLARAIVEISGGPWCRLTSPPASSAFPPTLIVHGDADTVVAVSHARRLQAELERLGVIHQTETLAGEGHWFSPARPDENPAGGQLFSATTPACGAEVPLELHPLPVGIAGGHFQPVSGGSEC